MRTGLVSTDDLLLPPKPASPIPPLPSLPAPTHQIPKTPIVGIMPMPASVMSPDAMLRAYAEGRALASPPPTAGLSLPSPSYNSNGMRTLYSPTTPTSAAHLMPDSHQSEYRQSAASEHSRYEDDGEDIAHAK